MMRLILQLVILFILAADAVASVTVLPSDPNITYVGRWGASSNNKVMASGGGNRFQFSFSGTSLSLTFSFTNMSYPPVIEYRIDGGSYATLILASGTNSVASGLANTTHTVEIWMKGIQENAPRWVNPLVFQGVILDNGASVTLFPTGAAGRMLAIGDSICEGVLTTGNASYNGQTSYSWGRRSFINQVCTALNLECWNHAFGGSGFYAPSAGGVPVSGTNYLYAASGISKADPKFDMVLIEVVNNDSSMSYNTFLAAYEGLIDQIRADLGDIPILCLGPFSGFGIGKAAAVQQAAIDKGCIWIDNSSWTFSAPNLGHPDEAGHTKIAGYLQPIIASYVPVPVPPVVKSTSTMRSAFR